MKRFYHSKGYTLMELMVVISIAAVILGGSTIYYRKGIANRQLDSAANQIEGALQLARSVAMSSADGAKLSFTSTANGWGWEVTSLDEDSGRAPTKGELPNVVNLFASSQDTNPSVEFNSAGGVTTTLNSDNQVVITCVTAADSRAISLVVNGMTGGVIKIVRHDSAQSIQAVQTSGVIGEDDGEQTPTPAATKELPTPAVPALPKPGSLPHLP